MFHVKRQSTVGQAYLGLDIHFVTPRVGVTYVFCLDVAVTKGSVMARESIS